MQLNRNHAEVSTMSMRPPAGEVLLANKVLAGMRVMYPQSTSEDNYKKIMLTFYCSHCTVGVAL